MRTLYQSIRYQNTVPLPLLVCDGADGVQLYSSCELAAINMLLVESSGEYLEWSFVDNNRDGTSELKPK